MRVGSSIALSVALGTVSSALAGPGDVFTYQAQIKQGGTVLNGTADIVVGVFDVAVGDTPLDTDTFLGVPVTDGLVTLDLSFAPGTFDGNARWLEISVDGNTLSPRQPVLPTPYAMHAGTVDFVPNGALFGTYSGQVDMTHPLNSFAGSGANLTMLNASQLTTGLIPSSAFSGTYSNPVTFTNGTFSGSGAGLTGLNWSNLINVPGGFADGVDNDTSYWSQGGSTISYASGNVGIGTAAPNRPLHVVGAVDNGEVVRIENANTLGAHGLLVEQGGGSATNLISNGAIIGESGVGTGIVGLVDSGSGVYGVAFDPDGHGVGVSGSARSGQGSGVEAAAVHESGVNYGLRAMTFSPNGYAGYFEGGRNYFEGNVGIGTNDPDKRLHVVGPSNDWAACVESDARSGFGAMLVQNTSTTGTSHGLMSMSSSPLGVALWAVNSAPQDGTAAIVTGQSIGLLANALATTGNPAAIVAQVTAPNGYAGRFLGGRSYFEGNVGIGVDTPAYALEVHDATPNAWVVYANNTAPTEDGIAIVGTNADTPFYGIGVEGRGGWYGVRGRATLAGGGSRYGVFGEASGGATNWAGYFVGNVNVTGTLSKSGGSFRIDHPLDPENKELHHSFVESPDMMNIYNGNVTTDGAGYADITMPDWFEALNRDFRYQLTVIDAADSSSFVLVKVVREILSNQFTIRTSEPFTKVSWQVTGVRHDPWANANRIPVEVDKREEDQGRYLAPEAYGQPTEKGVNWKHTPEEMKAIKEALAERN